MKTMRSWLLNQQKGPSHLELIEREVPQLKANEVLVKVTSAAVLGFDSAVIHGENEDLFPPATLPVCPGNQGSGLIEDPGTSGFKKGDRVMFGNFPYGFVRDGSWAQYTAVETGDLALIPDSVPDGAAAQAVVAYPTAYFALMEGGFKPGMSVLATGIGGSVGNAAYQLARALGASNVISTAGSTAKAEAAQAAGFDNVIDLSRESMPEGVMRLNGNEGVDMVIDSLGGDVIAQAVKCTARKGVTMALGFSAGRDTHLVLADLILRSSRLEGLGSYSRTREQWADAWSTFTRLADEGKIAPLFDRSFPLTEAREALRYLTESRPFGAVALDV